MQNGILVIISGFSGAGKGTVVKELLKKEGYSISVSATTRQPREGDVDGKDYFFKTREEFEEMIARDELIEYAEYVGNYYGTPKDYVLGELSKGKNCILEIEMQGALKVKEMLPDTCLIFVTPPDYNTLKHRLIKRGTDSMDVINDRLSRAVEETEYIDKYDYIVINDGLEQCVEEIHSLISSLRLKVSNNKDLVDFIKKDFKNY
ncbi:MAG: guanylate kinase [Lachnospiraceae bacterium]|nr:guanylate kinase [Lachnospiraceae bacterium]